MCFRKPSAPEYMGAEGAKEKQNKLLKNWKKRMDINRLQKCMEIIFTF